MLRFHRAGLERVGALTRASPEDMRRYRQDLHASELPDVLLRRGAGLAYTQELPQAPLLYLLVRALRPDRVVETGVRPGYSTAWLLAGLEANRSGELVSIGPGTATGRVAGVREVSVGQFVAPTLRTRWTLVLGNTEERVREILQNSRQVDLFFYDNGPDADRARFELKTAWEALSPRGILLAHHVEANGVWTDFCRWQGLPPQLLDPGPPAMGILGMRRG